MSPTPSFIYTYSLLLKATVVLEAVYVATLVVPRKTVYAEDRTGNVNLVDALHAGLQRGIPIARTHQYNAVNLAKPKSDVPSLDGAFLL